LDFFEGQPSLASFLTDKQLAELRPLCTFECDCGCPYSDEVPGYLTLIK
jgi:hypothetical protein